MWNIIASIVLLLSVVCFDNYMKVRSARFDRVSFRISSCYQVAKYRLFQWHKVRPYLRIGEGAYSRRLILVMIDAHKKLLTMGASKDKEHLAYLYRLLNEKPPPYDPLNSDSVFAEFLFLYTW